MNSIFDTGVYAITSPSGKRYIGSAVNFSKRWRAHLYQLRKGSHHSILLQRAYDKYGEDKLVFSKLVLCPKEYLLRVEQQYLDKFNPEYNINPTAGSNLGRKWSEETKRKMSIASTGRPVSEERRRALSERMKGHIKSEATRQKLSSSNRGKRKGVRFSDEHKSHMSESAQAAWLSPVRRLKGSGENHGRSKLTEAQVRAIRAHDGPLSKIAKEYGISVSTAGHIRRCYTWSHVK